VLVQQNNVFIDPQECGSSVGYHLHIDEHERKDKPSTYSLSATVVLADCNHKIDWTFFSGDDDTNNTDKIDAAIKMLQEFRKKFVDAQKMLNRLNK